MKNLNEKELKEIEGGMNDRPFGTSYDGYSSGGGGGRGSLSWSKIIDGWLRGYGEEIQIFGW